MILSIKTHIFTFLLNYVVIGDIIEKSLLYLRLFKVKVEYIIEGDSFKKFIRGKISTKKDGVTIKYTTNNVIGQNNYILSVTATGKNDEISRCLSQKSEQINEILMSNDIKFYTLRDDPSAYFAEKLYPLVSECENKIRKFVYITLFDLDEASNKTTSSCHEYHLLTCSHSRILYQHG